MHDVSSKALVLPKEALTRLKSVMQHLSENVLEGLDPLFILFVTSIYYIIMYNCALYLVNARPEKYPSVLDLASTNVPLHRKR